MGKAAILIIAASLALGSMYAFGAKEEARQAEGRLSNHQYEILARNAALAGFNQAKQALAEDFTGAPANVDGTYDSHKYEVTILLNGNSAEVVSIGTATSGSGDEIDYTIEAVIKKVTTVEIADQAPKFMDFAVIAEDDLELNGNILTDMYVEGNADNTLNADMHTNGNLHISGNAVTVRGFGTYVGSATANPSQALTNAFNPYSNTTDDPVTQKVKPIEIPDFDVVTFTSKAEPKKVTGTTVLSGTYDLGGTRAEPYVWHVQGDLSATGGTNIKGYVMFIVDGNVTLAGNVDASQAGYSGADESNVAFYANGTVDLAGNAKVYGQIYSGSGVSFLHGTPRVYGNVATKGAVTLSGTPKIYYREASPGLTTIFEDGVTELRLVSYSEW